MHLEKLFEKVSKQISPSKTEAEEETAFAKSMIQKLAKEFKKGAEEISIFHCGSSARDTGLRNDNDIDLFIAFDKSLEKEKIVELTIKTTKKAVNAKWEMHYAEHPYLQAVIGNYSVEVIPCFKHNPHEDIKSAVDRSPLHMTYLQEKLTSKQRSDVRVLKKLLKSARIYGAENEIEGFSGLACEYLIINYQSLENLLKEAAANWKFPVIIDPEKFHDNAEELKKKYEASQIILIDAIDKNRNAAAAISKTTAAKFILLARKFLEKPSEKFFEDQKEKHADKKGFEKTIKKRGTKLIAIQIQKPKLVVHDTLVPQVRSSAHFIARHLELNAMILNDFTFFVSDSSCTILFEFEKWSSNIRKIQGPQIDNKKACDAFLASKAKDKNLLKMSVKDLRLVAESKPKFSNAMEIISDVKKHPEKYGVAKNLTKLFKTAKILEEKGIAKNEFLRNRTAEFLTLKEI